MARYPICICMAGAVSAGAYTAGAMSVLLESLKLWESDDESTRVALDKIAPKHRISIKGMTGASAGSIQAILSSLDMFSANNQSNLGKDAWLSVSLSDLLDASDLTDKNKIVKSVLNTKAIFDVTEKVTSGYQWRRSRAPYVDQDYELRLSITNLRGVPYNLKLPESSRVDFGASFHNEYLRFKFVNDVRSEPQSEKYFFIDLAPDKAPRLDSLIKGGLASSAFPFAFEPIQLRRPTIQKGENLIDIHDTKQWLEPVRVLLKEEITQVDYSSLQQSPSWKSGYGEKQTIFAVDGGVTNNEPILEAFKLLSGDTISEWGNIPEHDTWDIDENRHLGGRVLFIDPFPNSLDKHVEEDNLRLDKQAAVLKSALLRHARFSEPITFISKLKNRVGLVYPSNPLRSPKGNETLAERDQMLAIKSGALGGFAGFLKPEFLEHDYVLGQLNMRRFLRYHFTIPADHALVKSDVDYIRNWGIEKNGRIEVPLIPVFEKAASGDYLIFETGNSKEDKWQYYNKALKQFEGDTHKFTTADRERLYKGLKSRFERVVSKLISTHGAGQKPRYPDKNISWFDRWVKRSKVGKGAMGLFVLAGWKLGGKNFLASAVLTTIENSLAAQNLLSYRVQDSQGNEIKYKGDIKD